MAGADCHPPGPDGLVQFIDKTDHSVGSYIGTLAWRGTKLD